MGPRQSIHVVHDAPTKLTLYDDKTSSELSELIYKDYGKFQVLNEANIIRTDEEIKELFNCKGEWEVADGVTDIVADMSF